MNAVRVLLLEDSARDAEMVLRELARAGVVVAAQRVATRAEFIEALDAGLPDAVITDYRLPDIDGRAAVEMVRARSANVVIIVVSGALGDDEAVELIKLGADDFVLKDRMRRLGSALSRALQDCAGRRALHESRERERVQERRFSERLQRSQADLERFAHITVHELQEPLRAVLSCSQVLLRRYEHCAAPGAGELVAFVAAGVARMRESIDELHDYAAISAGQERTARIDLRAVLEHVLTELAPRIAACGAQVTHGPLPTVRVEPGQIARVLETLIVNALSRQGDSPARIEVSAERTDIEWVVSVCDDGRAIDPARAGTLFELLQLGAGTAARSLAISRRIVEAHGGRIWTEPGRPGTKFRFTLPAPAQAADREVPLRAVA